MPKFYMAFCAVVLGLYGFSSARGIVYSAYLTGTGLASKTAGHYHK